MSDQPTKSDANVASAIGDVAGKVAATAGAAAAGLAASKLMQEVNDGKNAGGKDSGKVSNKPENLLGDPAHKNLIDKSDAIQKPTDSSEHKQHLDRISQRDFFEVKEGTTIKLSTGDKLITMNGGQVLVAKDGSTVTVNKDGSIDVDSKETVKFKNEGGKTTLTYPNGDAIEIKNNAINSVSRDGRIAEAADPKWLNFKPIYQGDKNPPTSADNIIRKPDLSVPNTGKPETNTEKLPRLNPDVPPPAVPRNNIQEQMPPLKPLYSDTKSN